MSHMCDVCLRILHFSWMFQNFGGPFILKLFICKEMCRWWPAWYHDQYHEEANKDQTAVGGGKSGPFKAKLKTRSCEISQMIAARWVWLAWASPGAQFLLHVEDNPNLNWWTPIKHLELFFVTFRFAETCPLPTDSAFFEGWEGPPSFLTALMDMDSRTDLALLYRRLFFHNLLGGGFKYFLFSPLFGEDFQMDEYFWDGLKPPTSLHFTWICLGNNFWPWDPMGFTIIRH